MRILNLTTVFPPAWSYGGPVMGVYKVSAGLRRLGHNVLAMTTDCGVDGSVEIPLCEETVWQDTPVVYYPVHRGIPFYCPELRHGLRQRIASYDVVLLHGNWTYLNWAGRIEAVAANRPYVLYPEGVFDPWALSHHGLRKRIWWQLIERKNYAQAAAVIALTRAEADQVRAMGVTTRIEVIPNGVDPDDFDDFESRDVLEQRFPALKDRRIVLFLARLHRKKGLDELLPAFPDVLREHPDALLVLAGPDDRGYKADVEKLVRVHNLDGAVLFTGLVTGAPKAGLLRAADLFVLPSYSEGLPVGVLEAMACARPVVITPHCNLPEVAAADAGLTVQPNRRQLAAAINALLADPQGMQRMGENGLSLVRKKFSWESIARQTAALCEEVRSRQ